MRQHIRLHRAAVTAAVLACLGAAPSALGVVYFQESFVAPFFDGFGNPAPGWRVRNNSGTPGIASWFQGVPDVFPAFNGDPDGYLGVNYNSAGGASTISNWIITPPITAPAGTRVSFVTRSTNSSFPDRMEFRASPTGGDSVGTGPFDVGDFTSLLVQVNPTLAEGGYPGVWTRYEVTLPTAFNGRFAFRYFVEDSGPLGLNGDYIGIDAFHVSDPSEPLPPGGINTPPPPPSRNAVFGGSLTGTLDALGQIDWYNFMHPGGPITINTFGTTLNGDNDPVLALYNSEGIRVGYNDAISFPTNLQAQISLLDLAAGRYYLAFGAWQITAGTTSFNVTSGPPGETGNYVINGISLAPDVPSYVLGDFNFDGGLDGSDVDPFVLALSDLDTYLADFADAFAALYPGGTLDASVVDIIGDFNGDSGFDGSDVDGFVGALSGGRPGLGFAGARASRGMGGMGVAPIPEPHSLGMLVPAVALLTRRRR